MSNQIVAAPVAPQGIDFEVTQTGQPVRRALLEGYAAIIAHIWARRHSQPGLCVYQRDQSNVARGVGGAADGWTWVYPADETTRWVRVEALCVGAVASAAVPQLHVASTTDAAGLNMDAIVDGAANFPTNVSLHVIDALAVTPGVLESIVVTQVSGTSLCRVLALGVFPIPRPGLDVALDVSGGTFVGLDPYLFPAGEDVITENIVAAKGILAVNRLRRLRTPGLFSNYKEHNCTSAAFIDLVAGAGARQGWDYMPRPMLPETADPALSVRLDVLAIATGGAGPTGEVRLINAAGQAITVAITAALGVRTATAAINRAAGVWYYEAKMTGTATNVRVLGACAKQQTEPI